MRKKLEPALYCICLLILMAGMLVVSLPDRNNDGYHDGDVAIVRKIVAGAMIEADISTPDQWSFVEWDESQPKRVVALELKGFGLLGRLDVAGLDKLVMLDCSDNGLVELSKLPRGLQVLDCSHNFLTTLDVSGLKQLKELNCWVNLLSSLDLAGATAVEELRCTDNRLTKLDVAELSNLVDLDCGENQLTELDVKNLTALQYLGCEENQLTVLDVSKLCALKNLNCRKNQLAELDTAQLANLGYLDCSGNQLTALNTELLKHVDIFVCSDNRLTALSVANMRGLEDLYCQGNPLQELELGQIPYLHKLACYEDGMLEITGDMPVYDFDFAAREIELVLLPKFSGCYGVPEDAVVTGDRVRFTVTGDMKIEPFLDAVAEHVPADAVVVWKEDLRS